MRAGRSIAQVGTPANPEPDATAQGEKSGLSLRQQGRSSVHWSRGWGARPGPEQGWG